MTTRTLIVAGSILPDLLWSACMFVGFANDDPWLFAIGGSFLLIGLIGRATRSQVA